MLWLVQYVAIKQGTIIPTRNVQARVPKKCTKNNNGSLVQREQSQDMAEILLLHFRKRELRTKHKLISNA